jgi:hypothetical protein
LFFWKSVISQTQNRNRPQIAQIPQIRPEKSAQIGEICGSIIQNRFQPTPILTIANRLPPFSILRYGPIA